MEKTYLPQEAEEKWIEQWSGHPKHKSDPTVDRDPFCIIMPPPNVTGSLHMGHALTFTLQDILIRHQRMSGKDVLAQPGTDHAGIATQMMVERQLTREGTSRQEVGRDVFLERTWAWKKASGDRIVAQLRRLGVSAEWDRTQFTLDPEISRAVVKVFVDLYRQGLIYRGKRLVNWDPKLKTAVSDLEVDNRDVRGKQWTLRYPLTDRDDTWIEVTTTRPETLFGDQAVAVHPEDDRYRDLIGLSVDLPLTGRSIPIVADNHADPEKGTGAVKITPAHDFNDFEVGRRHHLTPLNIMDEHACLNENVPQIFQGQERFEARKAVLQALEEQGFLVREEETSHALPYGDRSGVILEPRLTDQWYVDAATLAKPALEVLDQGDLVFVPENWGITYRRWLENIQPWCISRQLWWGHRLPVWYGPDEHPFVAEDEKEAATQAQAHYGKTVTLTQDPDVLDTWFSSALWPFTTLGWPEKTPHLAQYYPSTVMVTAFDIIFFWVARMAMLGIYVMKDIPFKTVYIHGLLRDEKGDKMSKTKGNVLDPLDLIENYSADAVRFALALLATPGRDVRFGTSHVENARNFITKLWNAARFCTMKGCTYPDPFDPKTVALPLNQWLLDKLNTCITQVNTAFSKFQFYEAASLLYHFVWGTYCDWYVELAKTAFNDTEAPHARETQETAGYALGTLCHLLHPFIPFVTEEIWRQALGQHTLLSTQSFPTGTQANFPSQNIQSTERMIHLISRIRSLRSVLRIEPARRITAHLYGIPEAEQETFDPDLICRLARLEDLVLSSSPWKKGMLTQVIVDALDGQLTLVLPCEGVLDLEAEKKRLLDEKKNLEKMIKTFQDRLTNPRFMERANPNTIKDTQEKCQELIEKTAQLERLIGEE